MVDCRGFYFEFFWEEVVFLFVCLLVVFECVLWVLLILLFFEECCECVEGF